MMKNLRTWFNTLIWIAIGAGIWYYATRPIPAQVQEFYGPITTIEHAEIKITWLEDKPIPKLNFKIPDIKKIEIPPEVK